MRDKRIAAMTDRALLDWLIAADHDSDVTPAEFDAFTSMRRGLSVVFARLTSAQRRWAEDVVRRAMPFSAADAPRGREVETPAVLKNLPLKPPGRR